MSINRRDLLGATVLTAAFATLPSMPAYADPKSKKKNPGKVPVSSDAWQFGIMSDTQWKANLDGENPGTCAVGIIEALNKQFIGHGVDFVIQVGDLVNTENNSANGDKLERTLKYRAQAAQTLYDAGIGFYVLRGNHEGSSIAANEVPALFPQNMGQGSHPMGGASNFNSPSEALKGLSYSFDAKNIRIVMLDQFTRRDGSFYRTGSNDNIIDQLPWINQRLASRATGSHALVLAHKNLFGQNHVDTLFGSNPASNPEARSEFIGMMQSNGVRYTVGGHDHMHHRSVVTSPDGKASVKQLIGSSNSYKFYTPQVPSNDQKFDSPTREQVIAQELWTIGYYIVTLDGPRLWVDYYSSTHGFPYGDVDLEKTPKGMTFYHRERWGYSLNGKEFIIGSGQSYTPVNDSFGSTRMAILDGTNGSKAQDYADRTMVKTVNTGWKESSDHQAGSDLLYLWGMDDNLALTDPASVLLPNSNGPETTAPFVLALTCEGNGNFGLGEMDENGSWVRAVSRNSAGSASFVNGPWRKGMALGTYGYDKASRTAWAVIDHDGVFQARRGNGNQG